MIFILILGIILGSPLVIILSLFSLFESDANDRWEYSEYQKERRHEELMELERDRDRQSARRRLEGKNSRNGVRRIRTVVYDEDGRVIAQEEVIEGGDEDWE